jgi:hypothetical protein
LLEPRELVRRQAGPAASVTLGLPHPAARRLGRTPDLLGNRGNGPLRARTPSVPPAPGPPGKTGSLSSWPHPLREWSLRETRRGSSHRRAVAVGDAGHRDLPSCGYRFDGAPTRPPQAGTSRGVRLDSRQPSPPRLIWLTRDRACRAEMVGES